MGQSESSCLAPVASLIISSMFEINALNKTLRKQILKSLLDMTRKVD